MVPEKKSKKSKAKQEFIIPEWAQPRQNLVQKIQQLQSLTNDPNLKFEPDFLAASKTELQRMTKESKYQ